MAESEPTASELTQDVLCIGCGYNLRGLMPTGRCPECGLSIVDSTRGNRLIFADPTWLKKLRFGASLKLWNILIMIVIGAGSGIVVSFMGAPASLMVLASGVGTLLGLWATFCITAQEPRISLTEDPITLRKVIRLCALTAFVGGLLQQLANPALTTGAPLRSAPVPWIIVTLIASVAGLIVMIGELKYFRRFALRAPDLKLARSTRIVMWCLAITTGLMGVGGAVLSAVLMPKMMAMAAAATPPPGTTTTLPGIGYTATLTTSPGAPATPPPTTGTTPGTAPAVPSAAMPGMAASIFFGIGSCVFMVSALVFFIWYVVLLFRYRKLFQTAMSQSQPSPP